MDRFTRTADIIKAYYSYKQTADSATFVKKVCSFFDFIKDESLSDADLNLLLFLANEAGIPQYYDLLKSKFTNAEIGDESINSLTMSALFHDASLIRGDSKLHRYQKHVLDSFVATQRNRYVLTAPTSFGKTFLVYEIIQKMQYQNVLLIFPAISLLSENYARLCSWEAFSDYAIHSLSEEEFDITQKNIFIFTPERFLSFMDSHQHLHFNFAFIDEVYKIDNSFVIDQETSGENERDTAYRLALEFICNLTDNMLLAGPYMALPTAETELHKSFNDFARDNGFVFLRYNQFEIVSKEYTTVKSRQQYIIDNIPVEIGSASKTQKIANIILALSSPTENTIIYCNRKSDTESYARQLLNNQELISIFQERCSAVDAPVYEIFLEHLQNTFGDDWIVLKALKGRIGIHHSLVPKYIQKEIISLFNCGALICLFSTTTITEGVNTSAKNIIITSGKKGGVKILECFIITVIYMAIELSIRKVFKSVTDLVNTAVQGMKSVMSATLILALAYCINTITKSMGAADFLLGVCESWMTPALFLSVAFVAGAVISFFTGSSWGTFAICIPIAVPMAYSFTGGQLGTLVYAAVGAVVSGGLFGDHCSPVSDTTVLSSLGAACDHIDHVRTQLPYALLAAAVSMILWVVVAMVGGAA